MKFILSLTAIFIIPFSILAQPTASTKYDIYHLNISDTSVNYTGKNVQAIAINGHIPAPTLYFSEGDTAIIYVHNSMNVETSLHWHGLLLPNNQDGVPYLTTVPIMPGKTLKYKFALKQSGTYWYHSHSMLQEQSGLYGAIVIQPKAKRYKVDGEQVLVLSDWTNEKPMQVLRTLKRNDAANEWYSIKKGYAQSLDKLLVHNALGDRLKASFNRMPPMDVSDVYYNAFLINGKKTLDLSRYKPGERLRLRVINGSASTYFNIEYAGGQMQLIAADGQDVQPVKVNRVLMGIAEVYDFIITVPETGAYEFRATAMDVSGKTSAFLGAGKKHFAENIPKLNVWKMSEIMKMADVNVPLKMNKGISMKNMHMKGMKMDMSMPKKSMGEMGKMKDIDTAMMTMDNGAKMKKSAMGNMSHSSKMQMDKGREKFIYFNYNMLKSIKPTKLPGKIDRNIVLNLTGNMYRYIWSFNNKTLSEQDSIQIKKGENVRITFINNTMMNHPIHLHGHFFRVVNDNGDYSPLKHTVDVPPMRTVVIEFAADEAGGDWFMHCHILYHMMSGMARIVHYQGSARDSSLKNFSADKFLHEDRRWFFWGNAELKSQMSELNLNYENKSNALRFEGSANYNGQYELGATYERYIGNWFRPFVGMELTRQKYYNIFNNKQTFSQDFDAPVVGVRYTLPFFIESELRINTNGRVRFQLEDEEWLLPRMMLNWNANTDKEYHLDLQYILAKDFSLTAGYDSRYKWGGGIKVRF